MCGHSDHAICQIKRLFGLAGLGIAILLVATDLAKTVTCGALAAETAAAEKTTASPKIREMMTSLAQEWLAEQGVASAAAAPPAHETRQTFEDYVNSGAGAIHNQILALAGAIPDLPIEFERALDRVTAIDPDSGRGQVLLSLGIFGDPYLVATRRLAGEAQAFLNLAIFAAFGSGAEWLFRKMTRRARGRLDTLPMETVRDRLRVMAARFALAFGTIGAFLLGGLVPWLGLNWDPARREMVLSLVIVFIAVRFAVAIGELLLAPNDERFRIVPMDVPAARFWSRRLTVFAGWSALVWVIIEECDTLGFTFEGLQLVGYILGLGIIAIVLEAVWRRPVARHQVVETVLAETRPFGRGAVNTVVSIGVVLLWVFWVVAPGVTSVDPGFWLVLVLILLPPAISVSRRAVEHLLRPAGSSQTGRPPGVIEATLEHGIRALLIVGAVAVLAWGWEVDLVHLAGRDSVFASIVHGVLTTVVILLIADVLWHAAKAAIDSKLAATAELGQPNSEEAAAGAFAHLAADFPQHSVCAGDCRRGNDGAGGTGGRDRAADRRCQRGRGSDRLWRADLCSRRHRRHVLPTRRRLPGRRIHPERQLQGHGRRLQHSLGPAAPPPRSGVHRAVQPVGRHSEPEPRLGHRQNSGRRHL
jgi:hypothetical protein